MLIATLEGAKYTSQDIHITYIDFQNAFGCLDNTRLLSIIMDLKFPSDAIELVGDMYVDSTTSFHG